MAPCAACGKAGNWPHCGTCKKINYCSRDCQKADFKAHKRVCSFTPSSYVLDETTNDALSNIRRIQSVSATSPWKIMQKFFDTAEIRMAVLSCLPAEDLVKVQSVCRLFYRTVALEKMLQQRLFLAPGPGRLVRPAYEANGKIAKGIAPRNQRQIEHSTIDKGSDPPLYQVVTPTGATVEKYAFELDKEGIPIILNPFFTKLWPQDPMNMTNNPHITVPTTDKAASWRRMQLTSPPMLQLDMSLWYTNSKGKGNQDRPSTGRVQTGVTMGHLADLIASLPSKRTMHWMSIDGHAWWARSMDAKRDPGRDTNNASLPGVYVSPSNGIAFPGFI